MNSLTWRYILIKWIRIFNRTILNTSIATGAFILDNIARLFGQGDLKISTFTFYTFDFGIGKNLYVGMPADLDQFS